MRYMSVNLLLYSFMQPMRYMSVNLLYILSLKKLDMISNNKSMMTLRRAPFQVYAPGSASGHFHPHCLITQLWRQQQQQAALSNSSCIYKFQYKFLHAQLVTKYQASTLRMTKPRSLTTTNRLHLLGQQQVHQTWTKPSAQASTIPTASTSAKPSASGVLARSHRSIHTAPMQLAHS